MDQLNPPGCVGVDEGLPLSNGPIINVFFPTKDAFVRGGNHVGKNYGDLDVLEVKGTAVENFMRKILIEFDLGLLPAFGTVAQAWLRLYVTNAYTDVTRELVIYRYYNDVQWEETVVTWENFPSPSVERGPTFEIILDNNGSWIDVDITDLAAKSGGGKLLLAIRNKASSNAAAAKVQFSSRETCHTPKLVVASEQI